MPLPTFPIIYSDQFLEHQTGVYHPENSGRLTAITEALKNSNLADRLTWLSPTPIAERDRLIQEILRFHTADYIDTVRAISERGGGHLDGDTVASSHTYEVALLAVSAWLDGVDLVLNSGEPVFIAARPPGHHARAHTGMGFCVFSNAAIAALYALDLPNIQRVAILDWDVHHGNGTQEAVWNCPNLAYVSTHQAPFYPYTGDLEETGAHGNVLNLPMKANCSIQEYLVIFEQRVIPFLRDFNPDLLIVSAGFDANLKDPLASMSLSPEDYGVFTKLSLQLTRKIVFGLEGGYEYASLAKSVLAVVNSCLAK
jgi:acetoin utilization deacetylase AcuC-like enzyme